MIKFDKYDIFRSIPDSHFYRIPLELECLIDCSKHSYSFSLLLWNASCAVFVWSDAISLQHWTPQFVLRLLDNYLKVFGKPLKKLDFPINRP